MAPPAAESDSESPEKGWWYVRFIRDFPEDAAREPEWYLDLLIANEIVAPVLYRHEAGIPLWRFHRRAAHDELGHALSLIIYATPAAADAVYAGIRAAPLTEALIAAGRIDRVAYEDTTRIERPDLEDVSDEAWPMEVQRAWPYFIMGVSRTWLELVSQKADALAEGGTPAGLPELIGRYRQVNDAVDELWEQQGRHAFLHHLNAVFGYRPLVIYERKLLSF
jgi:hypothetical protein